SPSATTRGLEETPYFGSTRLANLFEEAQLASERQRLAAATPRAALAIESERKIPIAPRTTPPVFCLFAANTGYFPSVQPTSAPTHKDNATGTRRKWGDRLG